MKAIEKKLLPLHQELTESLVEKSFKYTVEPTFKLVSGRMSKFYVNCKPTTMSPRGMFLVGHLIYHRILNKNVCGIGGLTFGADPIANAVAYTSGLMGNPINAFSIRKTQKDHGIVRWIEGDIEQGSKVIIIDDVATTGGSTIKAIERAQSEGLIVVQVIILVDRQEGGMDNIRKHVPDATAIITREQLMEAWNKK